MTEKAKTTKRICIVRAKLLGMFVSQDICRKSFHSCVSGAAIFFSARCDGWKAMLADNIGAAIDCPARSVVGLRLHAIDRNRVIPHYGFVYRGFG
jgi:hypothetical protein